MIGVYRIVNTQTGGMYIGKTVHLESRFQEHLLSLRKGKHENPLLQNTYNKHGESVFTFEIIEKTQTDEDASKREIFWIKWYRENGYEVYNVTDGGTGGDTWKNLSPERLAEIRAKGRRPISQEARDRAGESNRIRWQDPEYRAKMCASRRGKRHSEEWRRNLSAALKGKKVSKEAVEEARKGRALRAMLFCAANKGDARLVLQLQLLYLLRQRLFELKNIERRKNSARFRKKDNTKT